SRSTSRGLRLRCFEDLRPLDFGALLAQERFELRRLHQLICEPLQARSERNAGSCRLALTVRVELPGARLACEHFQERFRRHYARRSLGSELAEREGHRTFDVEIRRGTVFRQRRTVAERGLAQLQLAVREMAEPVHERFHALALWQRVAQKRCRRPVTVVAHVRETRYRANVDTLVQPRRRRRDSANLLAEIGDAYDQLKRLHDSHLLRPTETKKPPHARTCGGLRRRTAH